MSNGSTSHPAEPPSNSPPDVVDAQLQEAKKKAEKVARELADIVVQQQAPPGTPKLPNNPG